MEHLARDRNAKYSHAFDTTVLSVATRVIRTPAPWEGKSVLCCRLDPALGVRREHRHVIVAERLVRVEDLERQKTLRS